MRSKVKLMMLLISFGAVLGLVLFLYDINLDAAVYAFVVCITIGAISMAVDFACYYKRRRALRDAAANITVSLDLLPPAASSLERDYQAIIKTLFDSRSHIISQNETENSYMSDYYAMWVHQIKVPISAMYMLLENEPKSSPLNIKLFEIEQYVDMALSYVRLKSGYNDYLIKQYPLDPIVRQAVRKYAPLFIAKKISLDIRDTHLTVNTDEKWLCFVIEQVLSNSLKYTKSGSISIYHEEPKTLVIKDTGIGIAPEDIPRIGEKGYTGYNGRLFKKSTGLGLYLCKEILGRLSHTMTITSEVDKGTCVYIHLQTRQMMME